MNWPQQQPFPGQPQQPQQPQPQQQPWQQPQVPQQPQQWTPPQAPPMAPQPMPGAPMAPGQVAAGAQTNAFAAMLAAPARQRRNREKPADGTHVIQFNRDTRMETSQTTFQPYLLVSYTVIESTVPQMVNRTFQTVMMMAKRASVEGLAEMAKVIFGQQAVQHLSQQQGASPMYIAQMLAQHLVNAQTGVGLFALLNTWRSKKGQNGAPPPSYDDAFVNHNWLMSMQTQFSLAQAQAAGHQISMAQPPPQPTIPGQWASGPTAPAPQPQMPQQWAPPAPQPQMPQQWAPSVPTAPMAPATMAPPAGFPPPQNVQAPPAAPAPPAAFFPAPQGFPPVQR